MGYTNKEIMMMRSVYSPNSDSSGFSELQTASFSPLASLPGHGRHPEHPHNIARSGSPGIPFTYHNPALSASPYSTLPRRPGVHSSPTVTACHRHSPTHLIPHPTPSPGLSLELPAGTAGQVMGGGGGGGNCTT